MSRYALSHLSDQTLLRELRTLVTQDRATTAQLVAHLGEVEARRLYAEAGYPSMFAYCVGELRFSEDGAYRRIQVARTARRFPAILPLLADGRLNLTAVLLLAPCLTDAGAAELLTAAAGRSKAEIEVELARRFPRPDLLPLVTALPPQQASTLEPAMGQLQAGSGSEEVQHHATLLAPERVKLSSTQPTRVTPLAPQRFAVQFTMDQEAHDDLLYAQALLGHSVPSGDPAAVFARALKALVTQLEKQKFAKTDRPRACRASDDPRHVPADVKRAVGERDGGRCTFVGSGGHRCEASTRLEYDHVEPVARGGRATVRGLRLRCRAHNQYEAERRFGRGFMNARRETGTKRELAPHEAEAAAVASAERARARESAEALVPWLQSLGLRAEEARQAAERCESPPDAPLEERVRQALKCYGGPRTAVTRPAA